MTLPVIKNHMLDDLLSGLTASNIDIANMAVSGLSLDSRKIQSGWLFIALAHDLEQRAVHIKQALSLGATVILFDVDTSLSAIEMDLIASAKAQAYPVQQLASKTSEIAARFYEHPSTKMTVIAVTGTNGKTSVSQFIAQSLEYLGYQCGVIGTLGFGRVNALTTTGMTTPDPILVQAVLAGFHNEGITHCVLEASSHALDQGRLNSIAIDIAILTNLSRDHLDYHNTMHDYALAKQKLFEFNTLHTAIINAADTLGQSLITTLKTKKSLQLISYNARQVAGENTYTASNIECQITGLSFELSNQQSTTQIQSSLLGLFNVDNLLAALSTLTALDISFEKACQAIQHCHAVDGRMQAYTADNKAEVVIDFAHTPDALTQALQSLRSHLPAQGVLWCVFGCGGDRDKGKRAVMGQCAEQYADKVVLTADNPRSEKNEDIVTDILTGIKNPQHVYIEHDRQQAINYVVVHASQKDIVLVAGKGHEDYQEVLGQKLPFSDARAVVQALAAANDDNHSIKEVK